MLGSESQESQQSQGLGDSTTYGGIDSHRGRPVSTQGGLRPNNADDDIAVSAALYGRSFEAHTAGQDGIGRARIEEAMSYALQIQEQMPR